MITTTKPRPKTKRRGNGEGSIYQRGDGRWVGNVTVGRDAAGKRIRKVVYGKTKTEVQAELSKLQSEKSAGTLTATSKQTVAAFLTYWLANCAKPTIKASTYANYESSIRLQITPNIGGIALAKLRAAHVQGLYAKMTSDGCSPDTIRKAHCVLSMALKRAVKWNMASLNACADAEQPRLPEREIRPLNAEQVAMLLEAAKGDRLEALYVLAVASGMRIGELFALQWEDVDFANGAVTVRRGQSETAGILTLTTPKTAKSRRRIELPDTAMRAMEEHRKLAMASGEIGADRVFVNTIGTALRRTNFHYNDFRPLLDKAELPRIRFHDLRHTHASLLLQAGVHPKVVSERLGHANIGITLNVYSHLLPGMQREAASKLDRIFAAAINATSCATG